MKKTPVDPGFATPPFQVLHIDESARTHVLFFMSSALAAVLYRCSGTHTGDSSGGISNSTPTGPDTQELEWIARIQRGNEPAFEVLFRTYFEPLVRYATAHISDEMAARELVSDVFAAVWAQRAEWQPRHGVAAYLYGAVRNRTSNYERSRRRRLQWSERAAHEPDPPGLGVPNDPDDDDEYRVILAKVRTALEALPPARREAMMLRWDHQMTPDQIAQVMGITRTAVYHLLERSLVTLRGLVGLER